MLPFALLLLTAPQSPSAEPDVEVRVVLMDAPFLGGLQASLVFEDPAGRPRDLPMTLAFPRGFERLDAVAPTQIRPVEGTAWRAGLRALPMPSPAALAAASRVEIVQGPHFIVRLRADEIAPGGAVSVRFELLDGDAWARGFFLQRESANPEPARCTR